MSKYRMRRVLIAAALVAPLAGCAPVGNGTTADTAGGCDPHGFGPLSGCSGGSPTGQEMGDVAAYDELAELATGAFPRSERVTAVAVAMAESSGRLAAISDPNSNGTRDHCGWQINDGAWGDVFDVGRLTRDPEYCAEAAAVVQQRQGWGAWTKYRNGDYRRYLDQARVAVQS